MLQYCCGTPQQHRMQSRCCGNYRSSSAEKLYLQVIGKTKGEREFRDRNQQWWIPVLRRKTPLGDDNLREINSGDFQCFGERRLSQRPSKSADPLGSTGVWDPSLFPSYSPPPGPSKTTFSSHPPRGETYSDHSDHSGHRKMGVHF